MGPIQATRTCFRKLMIFSGRASRAEFWGYWLAAVIVMMAVITVFAFLGLPSWLAGAATLAILAPMPAAAARRAQDAGSSGARLGLFAALLFGVTMLMNVTAKGMIDTGSASETSTVLFFLLWAIGFVLLSFIFVWLRRASQPGPNKYGPNPHEVTP